MYDPYLSIVWTCKLIYLSLNGMNGRAVAHGMSKAIENIDWLDAEKEFL